MHECQLRAPDALRTLAKLTGLVDLNAANNPLIHPELSRLSSLRCVCASGVGGWAGGAGGLGARPRFNLPIPPLCPITCLDPPLPRRALPLPCSLLTHLSLDQCSGERRDFLAPQRELPLADLLPALRGALPELRALCMSMPGNRLPASLLVGWACAPNLRRLHVSGARVDAGSLGPLTSMHALASLTLAGAQLQGAAALLNVLPSLPALHTLCLEHASLPLDEWRTLAAGVPRGVRLTGNLRLYWTPPGSTMSEGEAGGSGAVVRNTRTGRNAYAP